ncbi:MAG: cation-transporting P-type ATPase, partial [Thermosynechococcaceae cyanobacterium]
MKSTRLSPPKLATAPWHCQTADAVLRHWQVDRTQGLSSEKVQQSLEQYGPNCQPKAQPRSRLSILVEQFKTLPVVLLSIAAVLSFLTGGHTDAIVIMVVVLINAVIGYATESQSERIIQSLKDQTEYMAQVLRDGMLISINIQDVVPGDVLSLKPGCVVAADARLIKIERLSIDESVLTGESLPVNKITDGLLNVAAALGDRNNMVYKGTLVTGGQGLAVVVATGAATELGRIQMLVGTTLASPTPM